MIFSFNSLNKKNYQQHFCQTDSYLYTTEIPLNVLRGVLQKDQEIQYTMGVFYALSGTTQAPTICRKHLNDLKYLSYF